MAKTTKKTGAHSGAHKGDADDVELLELDEVPDVLALLAEDEGTKLMIHRAPTKEHPDKVHCGTVPALDYEGLLDHLRGLGGGKFCIRPMKGSKFNGKQFTITVEPPPRGSSPAAAPASDGMPSVWQLMQQQQNQTMQILLALIGKGGAAAAPGLGFADVITAAKMIRGGGEGGSPLAQVREMLEVAKLLNTDKGGGGESTDSDVLVELIRSIGAPVAAHVLAERSHALPAPTPPPAAGAPAAAPPPADKPQAKAHPLRPILARLVKHAQANDDTGRVACWLVVTMGEAPVRELLKQPDLAGVLLKVAPDLAPQAQPHAAWFAELLEALRDELDGEGDDEGDDDGTGDPGE